MFFTLGTTTAFVDGVRDILSRTCATPATIGNKVAMVNVADAFGIELADVARRSFTEAGFDLVYDKSYPLGTPDLSPVMKGAKAAGPDAFVAWSYPPDTFGLAEQAMIEDLDVRRSTTRRRHQLPGVTAALMATRSTTFWAQAASMSTIPRNRGIRAAHEELTGKVADYWASANTYASLADPRAGNRGRRRCDRAAVTAVHQGQHLRDRHGHRSPSTRTTPAKFWTVGQWQDGVFRGVKGSNVDGAVPVRLKDGWE